MYNQKRVLLILLCVVLAFSCGFAFWGKGRNEFWQHTPKTFVDFPTQDLHAICKIRGLKYPRPVFLTKEQIDKLKQLVREGKPFSHKWNSKVSNYYTGPDASIQFYYGEEQLHLVSLDFGVCIRLDDAQSWDQRYEVDSGEYAELMFMLSESYQKEIGDSEEQE